MFYGGDLMPVNGFLLDSRKMPTASLEQLGLQLYDSTASDHLLLVADFAQF